MIVRRDETFRKLAELQSQNVTLRESCMEGGDYANVPFP